MSTQKAVSQLPRVVIVGAGFGGLRAASALRGKPVEVLVLDRRNYHLFQPLLYQVATAGLSPEDISYPVRAIFRRYANLKFRLTEVRSIDLQERVLGTSTGAIRYDYLILAIGGQTNYFGLASAQANAFGLKDLDEAINIRNHVLRMFELAVQEPHPERRRALLTFVVVGGGPTGVESAGALSELMRLVLVKDFPEIDHSDVRVILLEMTDSVLPGLPARLRRATAETLRRKRVEVRFQARVQDFDGFRVGLADGTSIAARTMIWAAGVRAVDLADRLGVAQAQQGRVVVQPTLQLPDYPDVFVIGDAAYLEAGGEPLPMMAPVAIQQAAVAATNVLQLMRSEPLVEFTYRDPGSLATIGRNAAVARIRQFEFQGFLAWLVWLVVHLIQLIGFRNRLLVLINWAWDYLLYERAVRIITPYTRWPWTPRQDK